MPLSWLGWRFRTRNSASEYHGYGEGVNGSPKPPHVLTNGDRGPAALLPPDPFHNLPSRGREETIRLRIRHVLNQQALLRFGNGRLPRYRIAESIVQRILQLMCEPGSMSLSLVADCDGQLNHGRFCGAVLVALGTVLSPA